MSTPMIRQFTKTYCVHPLGIDTKNVSSNPMTIMPKTAIEILKDWNKVNRTFTQANTDKLSMIITDGHWKCNGEPIIFDWNGMLRQGQHRLAACIATNTPIRVWVLTGQDPSHFDTYDHNRPRVTADDLSILGEKYCISLTASLGLLYAEENGGIKVSSFAQGILTYKATDVLDRHPNIRVFVEYASANARKLRITPKIITYAYYKFSQIDSMAADKFFEDIKVGANLPVGDSVLALRRRLDNVKKYRSKMDGMELLALVIKAWNFRRKGKKIQDLRWDGREKNNPEKFPIII